MNAAADVDTVCTVAAHGGDTAQGADRRVVRIRQRAETSASGVKVCHTSPSKIGAVRVAFSTTVGDQREVASKLGKLTTECDQFVSVYERKLTVLDDLNKSLLHQAFAGALTSKSTDKQLEAAA